MLNAFSSVYLAVSRIPKVAGVGLWAWLRQPVRRLLSLGDAHR